MSSNLNYLVNATPVSLLQPQNLTATASGTGVDVTAYDGYGIAICDIDAVSGTNPTLIVKLQECDTVGGTYTDITGAVATTVLAVDALLKIPVNLGACKKFVRATATITGTNPVYNAEVVLVGQTKY